jgi:hypothetical protein
MCCFNNCFSHNLFLFCGSIRACDHRRFRCGYRSRFWNYRSRNFLCRRFWSRFRFNLRFWFRSRWQWFDYGWFLHYRRRLNRLFNRHRRLLSRRWRLFYWSWRLR